MSQSGAVMYEEMRLGSMMVELFSGFILTVNGS